MGRCALALEIRFRGMCPYRMEVVRLKQKLVLVYWRNGGVLPASTITSMIWRLVVDAAQFFYIFPTEAEYLANFIDGMMSSNLEVRPNSLSDVFHIPLLDTLSRWLPALATPRQHGNDVGATRQELYQDSGSAGGRQQHPGGNGADMQGVGRGVIIPISVE